MSDLKIQGEVSLDTSNADKAFGRIEQGASKMAQAVGKAGTDAGKGMSSIGDGAEAGAKKVGNATGYMEAAIKKQIALQERLAAGDRGTGAYYEVQAKQMGASTEAVKPLIAQLNALRTANAQAFNGLNAGAASLNSVGMSAKQTAFALRGVPAQFTDIFTSLQGGQSPMTVFIQQGGQLKDMLGGVGPAAKAMGGYILGMINPITIAAAAIGTLAYAYSQGSKEADAYNKALILTGNAAGTTANQLQGMAANISKSIGTQGGAAEALAAMAGTGRIAASSLENFAKVAVQMEKTVGQSVADTAKDLAELGKSPVEASEKLNEKYRYLTASVYAQIKAMQEQGRTDDAAAIAQTAYANAFGERAKQVKENLGDLERGWKAVAGEAKKGWDAIAGIGRPKTDADELSGIGGRIKLAQERVSRNQGGGFLQASLLAAAQESLTALQARKTALEVAIALEGKNAEAIAASQAQDQARIVYMKEGDKYLSKEVAVEREITKAREQGAAAGLQSAEIEKRVALIRAANADKGASKAAATAIKQEQTAYTSLITIIGERIAAGKLEISGYDKLSNSQKLTIGLDEAVASGKNKMSAAHIASAKAMIGTVAAQDAVIAANKRAAESAASVAKAVQSLHDDRASEYASLMKEVSAHEDLAATFGMTKGSIEALALARDEARLAQRLDLDLSEDEVVQLKKMIALRQRDAAAMGDLGYLESARKATEDYKKQQTDMWKSIDSTAHDTFVSIFDSGKSAFDRLRDTLKNGLLDLLYQMTVKKWIFQIAANVNSTGGYSQAAGSGGTAGTLGTLSSYYSMGSSLYSGFSGAFASNIGSLAGQFGSAGGSSTITAFGSGMAGSMTGASAGMGATVAGSATGVGSMAGTGAAASSAGASTASAIPIVGWIVAGMMASHALYKKGWDADNGSIGTNLSASLAANRALKKIGLSGSAANIISGAALGSRVWGRQNPTIENFGIQGTLNAGGFDGQAYQNIKEKGGWFRSDKKYTRSQELDAGAEDYFGGTLKNLMLAVKGFGTQLGVESTQIDSYTKNISLALTRDAAANEAAIAGLFAGVGDELAVLLIPTIGALAKSGEVASVTLARLSGSLTAANAGLSVLGHTLLGASLAGADAASKLIDVFGGVENLASVSGAFYQAYYTEAERAERSLADMAKVLASVNLAMPETKSELRSLATSLDLTTESGRTAYATLLAIAPEFAVIADAASAAAEAIGSIFDGVAEHIKALIGDITNERTATAQAALQITNPAILSRAAIQAGIAGINTSLPGNAGILAAQSPLNAAYLASSTKSQALAIAQSSMESIGAMLATARNGASATASAPNTFRAGQTNDALWERILGGFNASHTARFGIAMNRPWETDADSQRTYGTLSGQYSSEFAGNKAAEFAPQIASLTQSYAAAVLKVADAQSQVSIATSAQAIAAEHARSAQLAYASAMQNFAIDASKSVGKLAKLREETVKYYDAQKALADLMGNSAANLRKTSADYRVGQLSQEDQFKELTRQFTSTYSMGLSTDGATLAGYGDKLNAMISPLLTLARDTMGSDTQYASFAAGTLARADSIASKLEALTPTNYAADSLAMLGQIDVTLAALDASSRSAEQIISAAINAGSDKTAAGLHAVVAALTGQAIPGFASGGSFGGGLRIVGERGWEVESTGPSRIFNQQQLGQALSGGGNGEMVAELRALRDELSNLRATNRDMANDMRKLKDTMVTVTRGGDSMLTATI